MPIGLSTDYAGSPLAGGDVAGLSITGGTPSLGGTPGATPGAGLDPGSFGLDVPSSGGGGSFGGQAAAQIGGAAIQAGGTLAAGLMQSAATDDARETARQMAELESMNQRTRMRQQEQLLDVAGEQAGRAAKQRSREFDLKRKHDSYMRTVQKEMAKQGELRKLLGKFASRAYSNAEYRSRLIRRYHGT